MRRVIGYLVISILVALLMTGTTFFVGEFVVASVPGVAGGGGSATVSGFPIPYSTFFGCCSSSGNANGYVSLNNTYYYHPLNFVADFTIWFAISLAVIFTFTLTAFVLAAAVGLGVTLLTLLLPPLSIVKPTPSSIASLRPMGFPYEYLTYYVVGPAFSNSSGYEFALSPALADYALWTGVAAALIGITVKILGRRRAKKTQF
jgi:hypothetical protein